MLSRASATRSTSMSATTSWGRSPAEATTSPTGAAPPGGAPGAGQGGAGVGLTGRCDVAHRVQRPGPGQQRPLLEFAGSRTPGGADDDQLCAAAGQLGVERREAEVVAN